MAEPQDRQIAAAGCFVRDATRDTEHARGVLDRARLAARLEICEPHDANARSRRSRTWRYAAACAGRGVVSPSSQRYTLIGSTSSSSASWRYVTPARLRI